MSDKLDTRSHLRFNPGGGTRPLASIEHPWFKTRRLNAMINIYRTRHKGYLMSANHIKHLEPFLRTLTQRQQRKMWHDEWLDALADYRDGKHNRKENVT